jgi:hypothetical protein
MPRPSDPLLKRTSLNPKPAAPAASPEADTLVNPRRSAASGHHHAQPTGASSPRRDNQGAEPHPGLVGKPSDPLRRQDVGSAHNAGTSRVVANTGARSVTNSREAPVAPGRGGRDNDAGAFVARVHSSARGRYLPETTLHVPSPRPITPFSTVPLSSAVAGQSKVAGGVVNLPRIDGKDGVAGSTLRCHNSPCGSRLR